MARGEGEGFVLEAEAAWPGHGFGADSRFSPEDFEGAEVERFRSVVLAYYDSCGRRFPWRETDDPYRILVSEIMLQQTQTHRVLPKYSSFLELFPTAGALAAAPLREVLLAWQGLGYNRRAKYLKDCAEVIVNERGGTFPRTPEELKELPGIGTYTAGAVAAFAFGHPVAFVETNIRTVFIHFFFPGIEGVGDPEILTLARKALDREDPRTWHWALMDYGAWLKGLFPNPSRRSSLYVRQSRFEGSLRQARGAVLRELSASRVLGIAELESRLGFSPERLAKAISGLEAEGLVALGDGTARIAGSP
jgi:A/G-specific adenine glycosylase